MGRSLGRAREEPRLAKIGDLGNPVPPLDALLQRHAGRRWARGARRKQHVFEAQVEVAYTLRVEVVQPCEAGRARARVSDCVNTSS